MDNEEIKFNTEFEGKLTDMLGREINYGDKVAIVSPHSGSVSASEVTVKGRTKDSIKYEGKRWAKIKCPDTGLNMATYVPALKNKKRTRVIKLGDF